MRAIILGSGPDLEQWSVSSENPYTLRDWQRESFSDAGIEDLVVIPSTLGRNRLGLLVSAARYLEEGPCLVAYGELAIQSDVLRAMTSGIDPIEIAFEPGDNATRSAGSERFRVLYNATHRLTGILTTPREIRRSPAHGSGRMVGLWRLSQEGWSQIRRALEFLSSEERHRLDIPGLLARLVRSGTQVRLVPVKGDWREVVAPESVELGERAIAPRRRSRAAPSLLRAA
ncbi:MAG: hypothetical protein HYR88_13060 [Verrucomicrobia bacterium]|nr:hypothetical protein [Verrucomicrobiota bacterium]MBI3870581.1 hypothetical protein [Verrucomicrobiota bacterium]